MICLFFMQDLPLCDFLRPRPLHISADTAELSPFCRKIYQINYCVNYFDLFGPLHSELRNALHSRGSQLNPVISAHSNDVFLSTMDQQNGRIVRN